MPRCKYCDAEIIWLETEKGFSMPVDATSEKRVVRYKRGDKTIAKVVDTFRPHFGTCKPQDKDVDPDSKAAYAHWNEEAERVYYEEHPEVFGR